MNHPAELAVFLAELSLSGPVEPFHVFADWLQSKGDPWGELIILQCNALRLESYSVMAMHPDLCVHDASVGIAWQRGFVSMIAFSHYRDAKWLGDQLASLFAQPVTALCHELSFAGAQLGDDVVQLLLRFKPHLDRIPVLDFQHNWFSESTRRALAEVFPRGVFGTPRHDLEPDEAPVIVKSWDERDRDA